jgi:TonB-linked SusC/RagA family outer membrane protein
MSAKAGALITLLALAMSAQPTLAQQAAGRATLTGVVKDVASGTPVAGVLVKVPGLGTQVVTDSAGRYRIINLSLGATVSVEATRLGYGMTRLENVKIDQAVTQQDLTVSANALSLTAVTSSATVDPISGVKVPFAMSRLDAEQMPVPNLSNAAGSIQGKVAGVVITGMSGEPGDSSAVVLRSLMSPFRSNAPLYVVDGVPLTNTSFTSGDFMGLDIESVEVIRGAAAASIYGSRASGGVIAITTKRGKDVALGTSQIEVRQDYGFEDQTQMPPRRQSHYFLINKSLQWVNSFGTVVSKNNRIVDPNQYQDNPYSNHWDPVAQAMTTNRSIVTRTSISQSSATTNLNISYTRNRTPGTSRYNDGQLQQNARFFVSHQVRDNLSLETSVQHTRSKTQSSRTSFSGLFSWDPDVNLLAPNTVVDEFGFPYTITPDTASSTLNPIYDEFQVKNFSVRSRSLVTADLQYRPYNWLTLRTSIGYDKSDNGVDQYEPAGLPDGGSSVTNGSLGFSNQSTDGLSADVLATALKDFGRLTSKATFKAHQERQLASNFNSSGTNFPAGTRSLANAANRTVTSSLSDSRINSGSINLGLDYGGKYVFDGLLLHEGKSRFGADHRWNDYYRLAGSWLVSEEAWYPSFLSKLTLAKVRGSYGSAGNQPDFSDQYENIQISQSIGFVRNVLGNPDLKAEMKYETEVGADFIWNNKISFQFTYSRATLKDAIVGNIAPALSGYNTTQANIGVTRGETIEGTVEGTWITTKLFNRNFRWWSNIVASHNESTIIDLGRQCYNALSYHYVCDNVPVTAMHGYSMMRSPEDLFKYAPSWEQYKDQFEMNDEGYLVPVGIGNHWWEGTSKNLWGTVLRYPVGNPVGISNRTLGWGMPTTQFYDTDGGISLRRWSELGNSQQLFDYGVGNRFTFGALSAYVHLRGAVGGDIWNDYQTKQVISRDDPMVDQTGKPDSLKKPQYYYSNGTSGSDGFEGVGINNSGFAYNNVIQQNNWVKLGELQFSYSMNRTNYQFLSKMGAERVNISMSGRDLYTFKGKYEGIDPEIFVSRGGGYFRYDTFRYPPTRKYSMTMTVVF